MLCDGYLCCSTGPKSLHTTWQYRVACNIQFLLVQEPDPPLHEAAKAGDADKVKSLLDGGADPCQADSRGKVPYDVAADKPVRDAFRRSGSSSLAAVQRLLFYCNVWGTLRQKAFAEAASELLYV